MRPFVVRCLKRIQGDKVENRIRIALQSGRYNQLQYNHFVQNRKDGLQVEEAFDISSFRQIVGFYWHDAFREFFGTNSEVRKSMDSIAEARNKSSHPDGGDISSKYAVDRITAIANVLAEINERSRSREVTEIGNSLKPFSVAAHKFQQGERTVYAFTLDMAKLDNLLPDRVDERVVKDANRPLTPSHAHKIQKYLEERDDWLLGTLLLGVSPDAV